MLLGKKDLCCDNIIFRHLGYVFSKSVVFNMLDTGAPSVTPDMTIKT